jgi:hypothetical protein
MASSGNINTESKTDEAKIKLSTEIITFIESLGRKPDDLITATDDGKTNYKIMLLDLVTKMAVEMPRRFKSVPGFATNRYKLKSGNFIEYYLKGGQTSRGVITFSVFNSTGRKFDEGEHALSEDWRIHWDPSDECSTYMTFKTLAYAHIYVVADIHVGHGKKGPDSVDTSVVPFKMIQQVQPVGLAMYKPNFQ